MIFFADLQPGDVLVTRSEDVGRMIVSNVKDTDHTGELTLMLLWRSFDDDRENVITTFRYFRNEGPVSRVYRDGDEL